MTESMDHNEANVHIGPNLSEPNGKIHKPLENGKISKSCDHCKLKKIKCDQRRPQCENCEKSNHKCVYSLMRRPGLKVGYGQQFMTRIDALDKVVESNQQDTIALKDHVSLLDTKVQMLDHQLQQSPGTGARLDPLSSSLLQQIDRLNQSIESNEARHINELQIFRNRLYAMEQRFNTADKLSPRRASLSYVINEGARDNDNPNILSADRSQVTDVSPLEDQLNEFNDIGAIGDRGQAQAQAQAQGGNRGNGGEPSDENDGGINGGINGGHSNNEPGAVPVPEPLDRPINPSLDSCIPPVDKVIVLVDLYFKNINPIFPLVHRDLEGPKILKNINSSNVLLLGVLINALKFGTMILTQSEIDFYFDSLKQKIITSCFCMKNPLELKTITLLAVALYSKANNHETWTAISMAVGGCLHLALIKDPLVMKDPSLNKSDYDDDGEELDANSYDWIKWVSKESLRHLVWEIYKLDKLSSMGTHFASQLPSSELTCFLPLKTDHWELQHLFHKETITKGQTRTLDDSRSMNKFTDKSLYGTNCYIIEVLNLMAECLKFRNSPLEVKDKKDILAWQINYYEIEHKIKGWVQTLPSLLQEFLHNNNLTLLEHSKPTVEEVILHGLYHTMIIRLHSLTAFSRSKSGRDGIHNIIPEETSKTHCLNSAHAILKLSESLPFFFNTDGESVYELFGPYYGFAVWVSGRVLLVDSINSQGSLESDFDYAISLLRKIGNKWECACNYADILDFFKDDTLSMDMSPEGLGLQGLQGLESLNLGALGHLGALGISYGDDAKIIADIKLNASSLDSLLSKKIARYKASKGSTEDLWVFDWFKVPLNEPFNRENY